ncbi:DUF6238 family protein [Streptomyces sp. YIM 98790]|uniref:DUF6238 family protein n=1 Tax=Streptomyces sp. YIM 98790 TaxID=2689077 RepID=UPI00140E75FA|nr:DUF6238 family protein [Streptomyces sp. YIM 98790]
MPDDAHPYLRAATTGVRRHTETRRPALPPGLARNDAADRPHLDLVHAHLVALHALVDQLTEDTRPAWPAAGSHLSLARVRLWQATTAVHDAFHQLRLHTSDTAGGSACPAPLPEGPPFTTICQRHLAATHTMRRTTTPVDLARPVHGHTTGAQ